MATDTNSYQSEFVPVSCKYPLVLLVRKSTFDLRFSLFSLKIDFNYPLLILRFDFGVWPLTPAVADRW